MRVAKLTLHDFRNHAHLDLDFAPGVSILVGRNGRGKTNIVEAVNYLAVLGSHRVATDAPLFRIGTTNATINAQVHKHDRSATVELQLNSGKPNKAVLNGSSARRPRDILGLVRTVIFSPEDLELVKGEPAVRRKYLDEYITMMRPLFAATRADYERVLKQRNALLKSAGRRPNLSAIESTLDIWNEQLATLGAQVVSARLDAVAALTPLVAKHGDKLSGSSEPMEISYVSGWLEQARDELQIREQLLSSLQTRAAEEFDRGTTLSGPHRDDLQLMLSGAPAKSFASHGQQWSFALALRLATFDLLREFDDDPILILDDVFAELDNARRTRLLEALTSVEQTLVTAAVLEDVPEALGGHKIFLEEVL